MATLHHESPTLQDQHGDTNTAPCGFADEIPGLNEWIDAQPPLTEADFDAMWAQEMEWRDQQRKSAV